MFTSGRRWLACVSVLAALGLAGCSEKEDVSPREQTGNTQPATACGTLATVRLCMGNTAMCLTEHTTLQLNDGTLLAPSGPIWEAYKPSQVHGQVLSIGYQPGAAVPAGSVASVGATITCLQPATVNWCGTADLYYSQSLWRRKSPFQR